MSAVRRVVALLCAGVAGAAALTGCSSSHRSSATARDALLELPVPAAVTVGLRQVPGLGQILVDGAGDTLYMFPPDAGSRVSCTGGCAGVWPPLVIATGHHASAGSGVNADGLSTLADPNTGARIVTYQGYPLYRYSGDLKPGQANGQALFNFGGPWYVLHADGQPVTIEAGES